MRVGRLLLAFTPLLCACPTGARQGKKHSAQATPVVIVHTKGPESPTTARWAAAVLEHFHRTGLNPRCDSRHISRCVAFKQEDVRRLTRPERAAFVVGLERSGDKIILLPGSYNVASARFRPIGNPFSASVDILSFNDAKKRLVSAAEAWVKSSGNPVAVVRLSVDEGPGPPPNTLDGARVLWDGDHLSTIAGNRWSDVLFPPRRKGPYSWKIHRSGFRPHVVHVSVDKPDVSCSRTIKLEPGEHEQVGPNCP
jgi:hypothetical protein